MRLIPEDDHHALSDAEQTSAYQRWIRRVLGYLFSQEGLTMLVGGILLVSLTAVLSTNYLDVSRNVDKNGIALKDFQAEYAVTVVDEEATSRKIARARQSVPLTYQDSKPHNDDIRRNLTTLLSEIQALNADPRLSPQARRARFLELFDQTPEAATVYDQYFNRPLSESQWRRIETATEQAMNQILDTGLTEHEDQQRRQAIIRNALPRYGFNRSEAELIYFLINQRLEPNLIVDEKAMEEAQARAAAKVEPETRLFRPGEIIVERGELVSPVQMAALEKMGKSVRGNNWLACVGVFLLSLMFVVTAWGYLYTFQEKTYFKPSYAALLATLTLLTVVFFQVHQQSWEDKLPIQFFPLAAFALTLSVFTHPRVGSMATTLIVFLIGLALQTDFYSLSVLLFGSFMGIYILNRRVNFSDRGQMMFAGLYVGVTNALLLMALALLRPSFGVQDQWLGLLQALSWGFAGGLLSGILTIGTMPLFEAVFRLVTPFTLMELGNHDHPLLKRMQFEAPGTFHHSLMVATLAEAAAEAIGANALLTRVGCLYHDIGKMKRPLFFIENQAYFGAENPHDKLTPRLSKMVITAHPRDSIEMAKQHKLPEVLMRFMTEHHGTLTAGYFYNKACLEEGVENVNKSQFRYPGPKPGSKETAIVMLADACESAVRALKSPTLNQLEERIDKIIQQRVEDGQFDNCPITFKDIHTIKQTFLRVFRGIQHNRIEYQQHMMRELGRKVPAGSAAPGAVETAGIQEALRQVQALQEKADLHDHSHNAGGGC